jgi:protein-S-isoprenylcysteine O-methyltransferase Ste14
MPTNFNIALKLVWLCFLAYWAWSARRVKRSVQAEPFSKRFFAYWLPIIIAMLLLGPGEWFGHTWLREQFVPHSFLVYSIGLSFCIFGVLLACWSRYLLGENWSATVQLKADHELIRRGPYRWVRHPIYSGLLLLFFGNALMVGDWRGLLAVAIVFISFWRKLRLEENWLSQHFGDVYVQYRKQTKAIIPKIL